MGDPSRNVFFVPACLCNGNLEEEWVCLSNSLALNADNLQTGNTGALELWSGQMWRRHGCRRKQAHETENNLFIKGWDAGCGGKLCSRAVETEWGLLGWLPAPHHHHCQGSMTVAYPRKCGKEGTCCPQEKGQIWDRSSRGALGSSFVQLTSGLSKFSAAGGGLADNHTPAGSAVPEGALGPSGC